MLTTTIDATTSLDDVPEVRDLRTKLDAAQAELKAAEEELDHLHSLLNPQADSSELVQRTSEVELLKARRNIDFAGDRYLIAKAETMDQKQAYDTVHREAVKSLNVARSKARLPYLRRFADALEEAAAVGDDLLKFDLETVQLGGSAPGHPFGDLADSPPYRQGVASRVRQLVNELEQRS